jgi:WD40 repeat protein
MAFSGDGSTAAVALFDSTVAVYDVASGARLTQLIRRGDRDASRVHSGGVNAVYLSRSGGVAVTVSKDCTARVWDVVRAADLTRDAAAGGGGDAPAGAGNVSPVSAPSPAHSGPLPGSSKVAGRVAPAAAAAAFLSAAPVKTRRASAPPAAFDPAAPQFATLLGGAGGGGDGRFSSSSFGRPSGSSMSSRLSGPEIGSTVLAGHGDSVAAATLSADERALATASFDGTARVWDLATGACTKVQRWGSGRKRPSGSGARPAGGPHCRSAGRLPLLPPKPPPPRPPQVLEHKCPVTRVLFSPDASTLLTVGDGHAAWVWDMASGRCICALAEHKQQVGWLASSGRRGLAPPGAALMRPA